MGTADGSATGLRIGQLAEIAGTTARAIRHYHAIGLLPEPARDASGYRRYGPEHLVRLVRIRRLRSLGMPLDRIAALLATGGAGPQDPVSTLRSLADDIARQIEELGALRARILHMAEPGALTAPADAWSAALRGHGLLGDAALPPGERAAADLLDALHPDGIGGVVAQASGLMSDPARVAGLERLLVRFRALPDDAGDADVEALAADVAALLPRPRSAAPPVDIDTMERLMGDRLSPAQRQCLRRVRGLLDARDR